MTLISDVLVTLENWSVGASGSNLTEVVNNYTIWIAYRAFIIDLFVLFIIALYLDNILPKQFGVRQRICYCFTRKYWVGQKRNRVEKKEINMSLIETGQDNQYPDSKIESVA